MKIHDFSLKIKDFHDFPRFLGKSGVCLIHPPNLSASRVPEVTVAPQPGDVFIVDNYLTLHGRMGFPEGVERKVRA